MSRLSVVQCMHTNVSESLMTLPWQVCVEVSMLSKETCGSTRDRLAYDQRELTDRSTYAGYIM